MITSKITPHNPNDETELSEDGQLCREAILKYGLGPQIEMVTEELGELIVALQKWKRKPCEQTVCNIAEEVADVELMLCQLQYMMDTHIERKYGVHLDEMRAYKRLRLKLRLRGKEQAARDVSDQAMNR